VKEPIFKGPDHMKDNTPLAKKDLDPELSMTNLKWSDFKWGVRTLTVDTKQIGEILNFSYFKRK